MSALGARAEFTYADIRLMSEDVLRGVVADVTRWAFDARNVGDLDTFNRGMDQLVRYLLPRLHALETAPGVWDSSTAGAPPTGRRPVASSLNTPVLVADLDAHEASPAGVGPLSPNKAKSGG